MRAAMKCPCRCSAGVPHVDVVGGLKVFMGIIYKAVRLADIIVLILATANVGAVHAVLRIRLRRIHATIICKRMQHQLYHTGFAYKSSTRSQADVYSTTVEFTSWFISA